MTAKLMIMFLTRLITILIFLSPFNQVTAQWSSTTGPMGGQVNDMTQFENKIFAACGYFGPGALYYSEDDGISWSFVNDNMLPVNAKYTSLAHTSNNLFMGIWLNGVYRSSDGGQSWEIQSNGISETGKSINCLFAIDDTLYAGSFSDGMYFSTDEGENWELRSTGLLGAARRIADFTKLNNVLYASTPLGIYKTEDEGMNWELSSNGIPTDVRFSYSVHHHEGLLYAGSIAGLYRSNNMGSTWNLIAENIVTGAIHDMRSDGNKLYVLTAHSVFMTEDGGENWQELDEGLPDLGSLKSLYAKNGNVLNGTVLHGTYRYNNESASWEVSNKGIHNISVYDIVHDENKLIAATNDADFGLIFASENNGSEWYISNEGGTVVGYICLLSDGEQIYAGSSGNYLFLSEDHANSWEQVDPGEFPASYPGALASNEGVVFGSGIGFNVDVFRSFDQGLTFEACNIPGQGNINALHAGEGYIYAGRTDGIYRSQDSGGNWEEASNGLPELPFVTSIDGDGEYIYTNVSTGSVFRSADQGENWEEIFTAGFQNRIVEIEASGQYVFLGSKTDGIFYSDDQGDTWVEFNPGLVHGPAGTFPEILSMDIKGDSLYLGTLGYGVWASPLPHITGIKDKETINQNLSKLHIFPNPVNQSQGFSIHLKKPVYGSIFIYNMQGRKVKQFDRGHLGAGTHEYKTDRDLQPGIYLIVLQTEQARYLNKLIVSW